MKDVSESAGRTSRARKDAPNLATVAKTNILHQGMSNVHFPCVPYTQDTVIINVYHLQYNNR